MAKWRLDAIEVERKLLERDDNHRKVREHAKPGAEGENTERLREEGGASSAKEQEHEGIQ